MKVTEIQNQDLKREYSITIAAADITQAINAKLQEAGKNMKIEGFRPGKAPLALIKKRYSGAVEKEVLNDLMQSGLTKIFTDYNLEPVGQPHIHPTEYNDGEDFTFSTHFEIYPSFEVPDLQMIQIQKLSLALEESDVEEVLQKLLETDKHFVSDPTIEVASIGNCVLIDYTGTIDGEVFEGGSGEAHSLELGSNTFIPGFETQLVGCKRNEERTIQVTFPENYHAPLAGKHAQFAVRIKDIGNLKPADSYEGILARVGVATLDELKNILRDSTKKTYDDVIAMRNKKSLFDALDPLCTFPVPESLVQQELKHVLQTVEKDKESSSSEGKDTTTPEIQEEYKQLAVRRVRLGLLLSHIAKEQDIKVDYNELRQALYEHARLYPGYEHKVIDFYRNNSSALEALKGPLIEQKTVDFLLEKITSAPTSMTISQLKTLIEEDTEKE